jgi:hypothetical protein
MVLAVSLRFAVNPNMACESGLVCERPDPFLLHIGGTLRMPNTTEIRTNADDHESGGILVAPKKVL